MIFDDRFLAFSGQVTCFALNNVMTMGKDIPMRSSDSTDRMLYRIDACDRIVFLDSNWQLFASENGSSPDLDANMVIGHSIWDFITGNESRHIYQQLFQRARRQKQQIDIPFRCDSPLMRRYMQLEIHPLDDDSIDIISSIVRLEHRDYMPLLDSQISRSSEFVYICSWCKRIKIDEKLWLELEEGISRLHLMESDLAIPKISHSICPDCRNRLKLSITSD